MLPPSSSSLDSSTSKSLCASASPGCRPSRRYSILFPFAASPSPSPCLFLVHQRCLDLRRHLVHPPSDVRNGRNDNTVPMHFHNASGIGQCPRQQVVELRLGNRAIWRDRANSKHWRRGWAARSLGLRTAPRRSPGSGRRASTRSSPRYDRRCTRTCAASSPLFKARSSLNGWPRPVESHARLWGGELSRYPSL